MDAFKRPTSGMPPVHHRLPSSNAATRPVAPGRSRAHVQTGRQRPLKTQASMCGDEPDADPRFQFAWGSVPKPNPHGPALCADHQRFLMELKHTGCRLTNKKQGQLELDQLRIELKERVHTMEVAAAPAEEIKVWKEFLKREEHADKWLRGG